MIVGPRPLDPGTRVLRMIVRSKAEWGDLLVMAAGVFLPFAIKFRDEFVDSCYLC